MYKQVLIDGYKESGLVAYLNLLHSGSYTLDKSQMSQLEKAVQTHGDVYSLVYRDIVKNNSASFHIEPSEIKGMSIDEIVSLYLLEGEPVVTGILGALRKYEHQAVLIDALVQIFILDWGEAKRYMDAVMLCLTFREEDMLFAGISSSNRWFSSEFSSDMLKKYNVIHLSPNIKYKLMARLCLESEEACNVAPCNSIVYNHILSMLSYNVRCKVPIALKRMYIRWLIKMNLVSQCSSVTQDKLPEWVQAINRIIDKHNV